jgi:hypothetical protein
MRDPRNATSDLTRVWRWPHGFPPFTTETRFRICCPQGVKAEQIPTKLPPGQFAEMGNGGVEGTNSFYLRVSLPLAGPILSTRNMRAAVGYNAHEAFGQSRPPAHWCCLARELAWFR